MNFSQSISNGYIMPTSIAIGSGEAIDVRCVCDTVEDFKTFLDTTGMELRYEGLITYEKVNKLLKVYKGNDTWQTVGERGEQGLKGDKGDKGEQGETPSIAHLEANISNKISEVDELIHQLTNGRTIDGGEL